MKQEVFIDLDGVELIVQYRKSALFFMKRYEDCDLKLHVRSGETFIDGSGLGHNYRFSEEEFGRLYTFLQAAGGFSWTALNPRVADSMGADYDEYYDRDFDNNGRLSIKEGTIIIEGCYTQPANKEKLTRLIKFNKRKFESFMYDMKKVIGWAHENI